LTDINNIIGIIKNAIQNRILQLSDYKPDNWGCLKSQRYAVNN
jgi:hypothetical protein